MALKKWYCLIVVRSAFFWYSQDERPKVRGANPEFNVGDVAKELGRRWADAGAELKSKYEALAEKDRARYGNAKREYQISLKNGTKPVESRNGDQRDSGDEEGSPPSKLSNLNSYQSHGEEEAPTMQERIVPNNDESAENKSSENNEANENNSSFTTTNNNNIDSSPNTTNDDTTVDHGPPNPNDSKSNDEATQQLHNKDDSGDASKDEEEEDLDDEEDDE